VGLECGSKPELQAVLALTERTDHLIVCNGYKDEEFMRLALMGQKLGHKVFIVLEKLSEVDVLLKVAEEMGVTPTAGVRIKLASTGRGRWAESGGEKSKFGLNAAQLVRCSTSCARSGKLDILKLIHFHLGSQITDIRNIKAGWPRWPLLRGAAQAGRGHHARGRGRRAGRGLRRLATPPTTPA
jgi:arginine decarboxylase